ncbi:hypothetical protein PV04_04119 [Phialophora macrospora]|uniref:C2H2-type domain-containing protein n=1 Tax=Phialophora macrospora TaxID=1851006 RepID=A0A0D2FJ93_9EURO|nr:hypothetical protein PV04_04119 [Phialophora macrospora]
MDNSETFGHDYRHLPEETAPLRQFFESFSSSSHRESSPSSFSWLTSSATLDQSASSQSQVMSSRNLGLEQAMRCPHPDCGKVFKDMKAHMLTHQSERPEKCPVLTCEYHQKGFARKYDSNRHTLTHFRGELVCGFCPGSGTTAQKTFNRADVFKRHLTSVHRVEQTPPNSRRRSPANIGRKLSSYCSDATGMCSICRVSFTNAQAFYMHLDACVLRAVQEKQCNNHRTQGAGEHAIELADCVRDDAHKKVLDTHRVGAAALLISPTNRPQKKGLTWSKGGVPLVGKERRRKKRFPDSWGLSVEKMKMKKRVLRHYDGERRLYKDNVPAQQDVEVRVKLVTEDNIFTELDLEILGPTEDIQITDTREYGLPISLWEEDPLHKPFDSNSDPRWVAEHCPSTMSPAAARIDSSLKQTYSLGPLLLPDTSKSMEVRRDIWAKCTMNTIDTPAAPAPHDRERKEIVRQRGLLQTHEPALDSRIPEVQMDDDCNKSRPLNPHSASTTQDTKDVHEPQQARLAPSPEDGLFEDREVFPKRSLEDVEPTVAKNMEHDAGEQKNSGPLAAGDVHALASNLQHLGSESCLSRAFESISTVRGGALTPSATESDVCRQSRLEADEAFESEGELSFMATPGPGDVQLECEIPSVSQRWAIQSTVAEQIACSYTTLLLRTRGSRGHNTGSPGSSSMESSSTPGAKSSQTIPSSPISVKKRPHTNDEKDDDNDNPPPKRPSLRREYGAADDGKLLACPYSKFDPARYSELNTTELQYRGCSSCFLTTIPRLKQHLYRVHSRPLHYCSCCFRSFDTAVSLDKHARARSCTVSPSPFEEKMTTDQMSEIKRRTPREERTKSWFTIFRILFPQSDLPRSPFIGDYSEECIQHFLGYFEREAPRVLAATINSELNNSVLHLGLEQRRMLDDILETSLSRVVVAMTQAARERQSPSRDQRSQNASITRTPQLLPGNLSGDTTMDENSLSADTPLQARQLDVQLTLSQSDSSYGAPETQSWLMVNPATEEHFDGQPPNASMQFSRIDDLLGKLPDPSVLMECDTTVIDHNLAGEEWQRLLHSAPPLELWQDGDFSLENNDPGIILPGYQPAVTWFD